LRVGGTTGNAQNRVLVFGKVTASLKLHWPCITDFSGLSTYWLKACCCCRVHLRAVSSAIQCHRHQLGAISCSPASRLVCRQLLTICDIVWRLPQGQMSVAARPHFFQQDAQWPWLVGKRFRSAQWRLGRLNPGCWIAGSSTREELTTQGEMSTPSTHLDGHSALHFTL